MHKNEPKQESNQATLARVKKEMDEPRMAASTREEDHSAGTGKAAVVERENEFGARPCAGTSRGKK
jgi:hypothetical protein